DQGEWLVNPGSVGQPRDSDPRAAWLELDIDGRTARFRRTEYDIGGAAEAILAARLPASLGERLAYGQERDRRQGRCQQPKCLKWGCGCATRRVPVPAARWLPPRWSSPTAEAAPQAC